MWINKKLEDFCTSNPRGSLRLFARSIGVSATSLSQVLNGKRPLSLKMAKRIARTCATDSIDAQSFLKSAMGDLSKDLTNIENGNETQLEHDTFRMISDWYCYGILSLAKIKGCRWDPKWIAERLGIRRDQAHQAFVRLEKIGLIRKSGRGFLQIKANLKISSEVSSLAIRQFHSQMLMKAQKSLTSDSNDIREFGSAVITLRKSDLEKAKQAIREFRETFSSQLDSDQGDQVYSLNINLIPLSK